jgi:hypothetical protein
LHARLTPSLKVTIGSYPRTLLAFLISKYLAQETVMTRNLVRPGCFRRIVAAISDLLVNNIVMGHIPKTQPETQ